MARKQAPIVDDKGTSPEVPAVTAPPVAETSGFIQETKPEITQDQATFDAAVEAAVQERMAGVIVAPMGNIRPTEYLVANQHTGPIMFPRSAPGGVFLPPLILAPGQITKVDGPEWDERKKIPAVQYYLDRRLITEVGHIGPVPVIDNSSTDLVVPPHLSTEEHAGNTAPSGAKVIRTAGSEVTVD